MEHYFFIATEVQAVEHDEHEQAYIWLAEKKPDETHYLSLAKSLPDGEVYIERDDQALSCTDGIEHVVLSPDRIIVTVDRESARLLGGVRQITVRLRGTIAPPSEKMHAVLRTICGDKFQVEAE